MATLTANDFEFSHYRAARTQAKKARIALTGAITDRCIAMNRAFEWTEENIARLRELDEFLSGQQRFLYAKVRQAERFATDMLSIDGGFLGGEFEIEGRLLIDIPGDDSGALPGMDEKAFEIMAQEASNRCYQISCSSYWPLSECADFIALTEKRYKLPPMWTRKSGIEVCYTLYMLCDAHTFSLSDLLALDRELFTCTVSIANAF